MLWIALLVVFGLMLAPVMYMQPTARSKQQIRLRDYARSLGLKLSMAPLPKSATDDNSDRRSMMVYSKPRIPEVKGLKYCIKRSEGNSREWFFLSPEQRPNARLMQVLLPYIDALPEAYEAIESQAGNLSIYWTEVGGNEQVDELQAALEKIDQLDREFV